MTMEAPMSGEREAVQAVRDRIKEWATDQNSERPDAYLDLDCDALILLDLEAASRERVRALEAEVAMLMPLVRMAIRKAELCGCDGTGTAACREAFRVRAALAPEQASDALASRELERIKSISVRMDGPWVRRLVETAVRETALALERISPTKPNSEVLAAVVARVLAAHARAGGGG